MPQFNQELAEYLGRFEKDEIEPLQRQRQQHLLLLAKTSDEARNTLVTHNIKLVAKVVANKHSSALSQSDMMQAGVLGLIRAIELYDPSRGAFSTYAKWWIRQAIQNARASADNIPVPPDTYYRAMKVQRAVETLRDKVGYSPSDLEVADLTGMTAEEVARLKDALPRTVSIDGVEQVGEMPHAERDVFDEELRQVLYDMLDSLDQLERSVLLLKYTSDDMPIREISEVLNVNRETARKAMRSGMAKLREHPDGYLLRAFVD